MKSKVIKDLLWRPHHVFIFCITVLIFSLVTSGNLWRLYGLRRDWFKIQEDVKIMRSNIISLDAKLKQAREPGYIERLAHDKLDLVGENELVFIFSEFN